MGRLNLVTGANGTGKSSLYRALRLLADAALNTVVASLAREGGLPSTLWAGPETIARSVRMGEHPVEGTPRQKAVSLKLGFAGSPSAIASTWAIRRRHSCLPARSGDQARMHLARRSLSPSAVLVDRSNRLVQLAPGKTAKQEEPAILTKELSSTDSMLASVADPHRAPEMLAVRESIRGWRFYEGFRTDQDAPVRVPQVGTFTPVLSDAGTDLAAALETIHLFGDREGLRRTIDDAFPGSRIAIEGVGRASRCNCGNMDCCGRSRRRSFPTARFGFCCGRQRC